MSEIWHSKKNDCRLSRTQVISYNTIDKYLGYMQDAFIIEKATRFDIKGKKYIGSLAKYYFCQWHDVLENFCIENVPLYKLVDKLDDYEPM